MATIQEMLKKAYEKLDEFNKKLEILEKQKADILSRYETATPDEKILIEKEIRIIEENFKIFSEEAVKFSEKVKLLKKKVSI